MSRMFFFHTVLVVLAFMPASQSLFASTPPLRNYSQPTSTEEQADIRYIVTTLAKGNWAKLLTQMSELKRVGKRITHVHPLRFLIVVFSDEKLKAGVHSIRSRGQIWQRFTRDDGLFDSLDTESKRNNLQMAFLQDFANILGIQHQLGTLLPSINNRDWDTFMDQLLILLPRQGNPGRLNM